MDSHTMVKSSSEGAGTMRATSTMSDGAQTMIEHSSTMLESDLGTMVINSDDEEEEEDRGSMRSERTHNLIIEDNMRGAERRKNSTKSDKSKLSSHDNLTVDVNAVYKLDLIIVITAT